MLIMGCTPSSLSERKGISILLNSINPRNSITETREQSAPRLGYGSAYNKVFLTKKN